jgi:CRP/FNR family cyclic AMP-dependent transcriptional regulator
MSLDLSVFNRFAITKKAGEIIFFEFEPGDAFYLIQAGKVKIVKIVGDLEKTLDILNPGEFFGEMALLEEAPRSATTIAVTDVKLLEFNRANFEVLMAGQPQIVLNLLKLFAKRIYDQKRRFMILTLDDIQARVADVFLMLDENGPKPIDLTDNSRVFLNSVDDIAHWAGLSVPKASEVLKTFVNQHRVEVQQGKIIVKNIMDFTRFVKSKRQE